ncbi:CYTH domain-containing protein [Paracoccus gahaiensis]|uniref:CYTH domain-containing protein n=1 Tax=Paracoccus gahaiensis TaxID=1706839 RepID=A0A4U0RSD0_9RHOB|nr:CYTH domain-containing protein [Paracoccus gahaiensis]TJZ91244.1 CYTH domain-containing protein [Paracoccus gahaiensis]
MEPSLEIERKFLVTTLPDLAAASRSSLRQGYLTVPEDSVEVRLRQTDGTFILCVKSGEGIVRGEREIEISEAQFQLLWPQTEGRRVEKTRWTGGLDQGLTFELDIFGGALAPLMMVEVEFRSEAEAHQFVAPDWFGRDVSTDRRFGNKSLALSGASFIRELSGG